MPRPTYQQLEAKLAALTDELESVMDENQTHRRKEHAMDYTEQNALAERVEKTTRKLAAMPVPSAVMEGRFMAAFDKLRADFPMCHVEAWMPGDFATKPDGDTSRVNWHRPLWVSVARRLSDAQDASVGTNWDSIFDAVSEEKAAAKHFTS